MFIYLQGYRCITMKRRIKTVTGILTIIAIAAIGWLAYSELAKNDAGGTDTVLTLTFQEYEWTYTLTDLGEMDSYTGDGGMKTQIDVIGPWTFKGVRFSTLLADIGLLPMGDLEMNVIGADGHNQTFDLSAITGNVTTYDAAGNETEGCGCGGGAKAVPLFAYKQDGGSIGDENGPIRVAYVGDSPVYTRSHYWVTQVVRIELK